MVVYYDSGIGADSIISGTKAWTTLVTIEVINFESWVDLILLFILVDVSFDDSAVFAPWRKKLDNLDCVRLFDSSTDFIRGDEVWIIPLVPFFAESELDEEKEKTRDNSLH